MKQKFFSFTCLLCASFLGLSQLALPTYLGSINFFLYNLQFLLIISFRISVDYYSLDCIQVSSDGGNIKIGGLDGYVIIFLVQIKFTMQIFSVIKANHEICVIEMLRYSPMEAILSCNC